MQREKVEKGRDIGHGGREIYGIRREGKLGRERKKR